MNTYYVNSYGQTQQIGQADDSQRAAADATAIAQYGALAFSNPTGGRPITGGQVWVERTGSGGWVPLVYTGTPKQTDAPSVLSRIAHSIPGWAWLAAAAGGAYYLVTR